MLRSLLLVFAAACCLPTTRALATDEAPLVEIYMPSPCLACIDWGSYLADRGFRVAYKETADMAAVRSAVRIVISLHRTG